MVRLKEITNVDGFRCESLRGFKEEFTGVTRVTASQDAAQPTSHLSDSNLVKVANDFH